MAPDLTTSNKKLLRARASLLVTKGITTRSKYIATRNKWMLLGTKELESDWFHGKLCGTPSPLVPLA